MSEKTATIVLALRGVKKVQNEKNNNGPFGKVAGIDDAYEEHCGGVDAGGLNLLQLVLFNIHGRHGIPRSLSLH